MSFAVLIYLCKLKRMNGFSYQFVKAGTVVTIGYDTNGPLEIKSVVIR